MPISYAFRAYDGSDLDTLKANAPMLNLNDVDRELCEHLGDPCDEKRFHPMFHMLVDVGISYLMRTSGSYVENPDFAAVFKEKWPEIDQESKDLIEWVFKKKWLFSAWR